MLTLAAMGAGRTEKEGNNELDEQRRDVHTGGKLVQPSQISCRGLRGVGVALTGQFPLFREILLAFERSYSCFYVPFHSVSECAGSHLTRRDDVLRAAPALALASIAFNLFGNAQFIVGV